jgi:type I restriction enzyme M protein
MISGAECLKTIFLTSSNAGRIGEIGKFQQKRAQRLAELQKQIAPLKKNRLEHHATIHRLQFEEVVAPDTNKARASREEAEAELAELKSRIVPVQIEVNRLTRQFWITKEQASANKYDLSASRYRQVEQDDEFYEQPRVTLQRLQQLNSLISTVTKQIEQSLK